MKTSPPEITLIESLQLSASSFAENVSESLVGLNHWLEQQLGAELTTALAVGFGCVSLFLASCRYGLLGAVLVHSNHRI